MGMASCLSGDGAVGCYTVFPFTSVSAPHPIQGDPKCRVMDKTYYMYTEKEEKIWWFYLFQQYQRAWQCFPMVSGARRVQQQSGLSLRVQLLGWIWKHLKTLFSCSASSAAGLQAVFLPVLMVQRGHMQKGFPVEGQQGMAGQKEAVTPKRSWSQGVLFSAILLPEVWELWKHDTTHTWEKK